MGRWGPRVMIVIGGFFWFAAPFLWPQTAPRTTERIPQFLTALAGGLILSVGIFLEWRRRRAHPREPLTIRFPSPEVARSFVLGIGGFFALGLIAGLVSILSSNAALAVALTGLVVLFAGTYPGWRANREQSKAAGYGYWSYATGSLRWLDAAIEQLGWSRRTAWSALAGTTALAMLLAVLWLYRPPT